MRLGKPIEIDSISDALGKAACPICAYLKNEQASLLKGGLNPTSIVEICNFHAWALAAAVNVENAASIFLNVLRHRASGDHSGLGCSICARLVQDEVTQSRNLLAQLRDGHTLNWFSEHGVVCQMYGDHLAELASPELKSIIEEVANRSTRHIEEALENLRRRAGSGRHEGSGALGRAAELLTSQRGVNR